MGLLAERDASAVLQATYDHEADALYVRLTSAEVTKSDQLDPGTLVDLDASGAVVGIAVLQPARLWPVALVIERYGISGIDRTLLELMFPRIGGYRRLPFPAVEHEVSATTQLVDLGVACA